MKEVFSFNWTYVALRTIQLLQSNIKYFCCVYYAFDCNYWVSNLCRVVSHSLINCKLNTL